MSSLSFFLSRPLFLATALLLTTPVRAQERVAIPAPADDPEALADRETVAGGEVRFVPITEMDDSIPLPGAGRMIEAPNGATELPPENADPFFLGFVAGDYFPPAEESVDPILRTRAALVPAERANGVTYGFAMFSKRMTAERIELLESMGVRVLGRHPHYAASVALPPGAIDAVAHLDFIRWVGVPRSWQTIHPQLAEVAESGSSDVGLDVWINVYESDLCDASSVEYVGAGALVDAEAGVVGSLAPSRGVQRSQSNGWQHQALVQAGVEIGQYSDSIRAFHARLTPAQLAVVRGFDFVQFIEPSLEPTLLHEESQPMCAVDLTRPTNTGGTFGDAIVGVADTGLEVSHYALNHVNAVGWDLASSSNGPFVDDHGHGSHVAGTMFAGQYAGQEARYGAAPGLGAAADLRVFVARLFDDNGNWGWATMQDILNVFHQDFTDGGNNTTTRPHIVNHSWGSAPAPFIGSEADARLIDNEVYIYRQLYTFAGGNFGPNPSTLTAQSSAKNAFSVGNVYPFRTTSGPPETIRGTSSRGPCGDGRWKPNLVAPGVNIVSVDASSPGAFKPSTGTSMSAPQLSGIAAQLVDRYDFLQYNATTLAAVLMGTALSTSTHTSPTDSYLDTYGTGRVSAYRAIGGNPYQALYFWGYVQSDTAHAELDFDVFPGAARVTVVMTYHELSASAGASKALVQDIDTYIDRAPFTGSGSSGDWSFQISHLDNTEIRTLQNPADGAYKVKTWPTDVTSGWFKPWVGVCVVVDYGDTTPTGTIGVVADKTLVKPGDTVQVLGAVANQPDGNIAQSVYLDASIDGMILSSVHSHLADGAVSELVDNIHTGTEVMLGDMRYGQTRYVVWEGNWGSEGVKTFSVDTLSPTMNAASGSVQVVVDGSAPGLAQNVHSTDHSTSAHSCDLSISMDWDPAVDTLSGVAGYSYLWNHSLQGTPDTVIDTTGTSSNTTLTGSSQGWYFHVRAIDEVGHAGGSVHIGPYFLGAAQASNYCNSNPNSTGQMASLAADGPLCLAAEQFTLRTTQLPAGKVGYYLFSSNKGNVPFFGGSQGVLCLGGPIYRWNGNILSSGASGEMVFSPDLDNLPQGQSFAHGSTWNFQLWYRDNNPGSTSNTSNGLEVVWD